MLEGKIKMKIVIYEENSREKKVKTWKAHSKRMMHKYGAKVCYILLWKQCSKYMQLIM